MAFLILRKQSAALRLREVGRDEPAGPSVGTGVGGSVSTFASRNPPFRVYGAGRSEKSFEKL